MDQTSDPKYQRLTEMIADQIGIVRHELVPSSIIQIDCGIEGADAEQLLANIQKEFHVDFSNFEFSRYFHDEFGMSVGLLLFPVMPVCWAIMRLTKSGSKVDITVEDLFNAISAGRWTDPNRAPKYPWERRRRTNRGLE